jgi:predicted transcriptional regulator
MTGVASSFDVDLPIISLAERFESHYEETSDVSNRRKDLTVDLFIDDSGMAPGAGGAESSPNLEQPQMSDTFNHIELAAEIVSAYVSNNSVPASDLPTLLGDVHAAIVRVSTGTAVVVPEAAKPAIAPKKSITNDYLICLEDGRKFKSLKRHLRTQYNLSPEEYREKWGLPSDYPMVAPAYAKARSALAKQMGLGQQRRRRK